MTRRSNAANPGGQHIDQMFLTGSQFWRGRETGVNPQIRLRSTENSAHVCMFEEVGGTNVEYNANLTSPGIQHRDARMVAHPDILTLSNRT